MGKACSMHYRYDKSIQNLVQKAVKEGDHLEDLGIGGRIM